MMPIVLRSTMILDPFLLTFGERFAGGCPVRWIVWPAIPIMLVLVLGAGSMVAGEAATTKRVVSPSGRPATETVTTLQTRWPVRGPINSSFGRRGGWSGNRHFHAGVDIGARRGTPIHAPAPGTVTFAGWRSRYGRTVVIDHGGQVQSLYGHLSRLDVRRHQKVGAGSEIGRTGMTGNASGPHLHYEVRVKGSPVNPRTAARGSVKR